VFDGAQGHFVARNHLSDFLAAHPKNGLIFHGAAFGLASIAAVTKSAAVYDRVDRNEVRDTQIFHHLCVLASEGRSPRDGDSLDDCVLAHLIAYTLGV
jgi:hypothetical protein